MIRQSTLKIAFVICSSAGCFTSVVALAKGNSAEKSVPSKSEEPSADLANLEKQLDGDEDAVVAALNAIGESGDPKTAPLVGKVLERGGTVKVLDAAMKAAGKLKVESLSPAIAPYVRHRQEEIRHAAVKALLKTKGPAAVEALKKGLRSPDAVVRGTSATGLGALGAHDAVGELFLAFDHGVPEAGAAIGQLCNPADCEKFADRTGKVSFDIMASGFDQILFRPAEEIPDDEKLRLVGRLRELGTPDVGKYLADVSERWPKGWSQKIKQALEAAVRAVGGAKK